MSDEEKDETTAETEATPDGDAETEGAKGGSTRMPSVLSRPTDYVARPGFRNPSNAKSKAQKGKRKKKR